MIKCNKCGAVCADNELVCASCRNFLYEDLIKIILEDEAEEAKPAEEKSAEASESKESRQSIYMKYADVLDADALYAAAICKLNGTVTAANAQEARILLERAALKGSFDAMNKLAEIILQEEGGDKSLAQTWLSIAADGGHEPSKIKLKTLGVERRFVKSESAVASSPLELVEAVKNALPSIVAIRSTFASSSSTGSGFILDGGYVVTNAHVVGKNPKCITARFDSSIDEKVYNLTPIAVEHDCDVAILKFTGLAERKFTAQSNLSLRVSEIALGEDVYTIGCPLGLDFSVSRGVISCPSRKYGYPKAVEEVIQTDITANPGNSGGALLDSSNNVLGMITFHPERSNGGISMCVPASYIVKVINNIN